ncbi:MAG: ABC transporter ATP-binding protein, partial [Alphaproteobacteria bacterium]
DAKLREEMRGEIRDLVKRLGITTVYVTHDQLEALTMSDVVAVMDSGVIAQQGPPEEIYERPRNRFVAGFIGRTNMVAAKIREIGASNGVGVADTERTTLRCVMAEDMQPGQEIAVCVRPENIYIGDAGNGAEANHLPGRVTETSYLGDSLTCIVETEIGALDIRLHPSKRIRAGEAVTLSLPVAACRAVRD